MLAFIQRWACWWLCMANVGLSFGYFVGFLFRDELVWALAMYGCTFAWCWMARQSNPAPIPLQALFEDIAVFLTVYTRGKAA